MPKQVVSVRFPEGTASKYFTDWGGTLVTSSTFNLPPDLTNTDRDSIVSAIGGTIDAELPPCPDLNGNLRKLKFIRQKGNIMSVPVRTREDLFSAATVIRGVLNSANGGNNKVVCIELLGEDFPNINDEMGLSYTAGTFAPTHRAPATATKQYFHAGTIQYQGDCTNPPGGVVFQPVKAISELEDAPASQLGGNWATCVGDFVAVAPCPRPAGRLNPLKHRRFIMSYLVGAADNFTNEKIEVPVKDYASNAIKTCGQNLAGTAGAYCIGYRGESYRSYHRLLAA